MFTDVDVWQRLIVDICEKEELGIPKTIEVGNPGTCAVFIVTLPSEQLVMKIYPPMLPDDFGKEREAYKLLTYRLHRLPTHITDGIAEDQIDWPYLIMGWCEGDTIGDVFDELSADDRLKIGAELGQMIRVIHDSKLDKCTSFPAKPADQHRQWQAFLQKRQAAFIAELEEDTELSPEVLEGAREFVDTMMPDLLDETEPMVLLHADLTEDHLLLLQGDGLVNLNDWTISALIDWADAEVGAAAYDWVALWFGLCQRDHAMFREVLTSYNPDTTFDGSFYRRLMAYTLLHRFGPGIIDHVLSEVDYEGTATFNHLIKTLFA